MSLSVQDRCTVDARRRSAQEENWAVWTQQVQRRAELEAGIQAGAVPNVKPRQVEDRRRVLRGRSNSAMHECSKPLLAQHTRLSVTHCSTAIEGEDRQLQLMQSGWADVP